MIYRLLSNLLLAGMSIGWLTSGYFGLQAFWIEWNVTEYKGVLWAQATAGAAFWFFLGYLLMGLSFVTNDRMFRE
jgi:hypothetical protein